jgi:uncharacterized protein YbaR (Trm112 family)
MFIELTDHLRCPAEHDEQFLVLLPELIEDRWVRAGDLGCPVCGRAFRVDDGIFESGEPPEERGTSALPADAVAALSGLGGPGGYLVLVGGAAGTAGTGVTPGVGVVAVNPEPAIADGTGGASVIRGSRLPLRSSSMRAVVLGPGYAEDPYWIAEAMRVTLPGLRIVGEGEPPVRPDLEILASAAGCWVATKIRNRPPPTGTPPRSPPDSSAPPPAA